MTDTLITVDLQFQKLLQRAREGQAAGREVQVDREQQRKVEAAGRAERGVRERITIPGQVLQQGRSRRGVHSSPQNVTKRPKEQPAAGYVQGTDLAMWGPSDKYMEWKSLKDLEWGFFAGWRGFAFVASSQMRTINGVGVYTPLASGLVTPKPVAIWKCSKTDGFDVFNNPVKVIRFDEVLAYGTANVGMRPQLRPYVFVKVPTIAAKPGEIYAAMAHYAFAGNFDMPLPLPEIQYPKDYPVILQSYQESNLAVPDATDAELVKLYQRLSKFATVARPVAAANSFIYDPNRPDFTSTDPALAIGQTVPVDDFSLDDPATLGNSFPNYYSTTMMCNTSKIPRTRPTWWRPPA